MLIDARKGVLTQSKRHAYLAHLLGVPHLVVAVNKMDLVDYTQETFEKIRAEFNEFAKGLGARDLHFVPLSALHGDMVVTRGERLRWYRGPTLLELLETLDVAANRAEDAFRFPVQLLAWPDAAIGRARRGYLGRIESGTVKVGDAVTVLPSGMTSTIAAIKTLDGDLIEAGAPLSVTLELADEIDISRGDMIVHQPAVGTKLPVAARRIEATLCWLHARALDRRRPYLVKHTTRTVKAEIENIVHTIDIQALEPRSGAQTLAMNDIARVSLRLYQPLICDAYAENRMTGAFIVIDPADNATVAAGMIGAPVPGAV